VTIKKTDIHLRLFQKSDIDKKVKWINDPKVNEYLHYDLPLCPDRTLNWYNNIINAQNREDYVFEVNFKGRMVPVGLIGLLDIDNKNKKAEFYIVNGETKYQGQGIATHATTKFLKHVFLKHDLNKVYLFTEVNNVAAQNLFEKIGFNREGTLKEDLIFMGRKVDRYCYSILRGDFMNE